ncbi:MAG: NAD(P)/FAD-dependent oxidoreductase [Saprospiraceae bacterium]|nr:NAD(P)/FAD-dependent oxidoreductase [Saprospiraceae bacterium]
MNESRPKDLAIIGGGAAGYFAAITAAETNPSLRVVIFERGREVLQKVRISGGGRCNVTHACFDPVELVHYYPRGEKELLGPFMRFAPGDTVEWFLRHGVKLKTEEDGRMFPVTDQSGTIVHCLMQAASQTGVEVQLQSRVEHLVLPKSENAPWVLTVNGQKVMARKVMLAAGSSTAIWKLLVSLGIHIIDPVPSLFTFNIKDPRIQGLLGISVPEAEVTVQDGDISARGPLLITHWGLSGPAILKCSAWGARELAQRNYQFSISINWTGKTMEVVQDWMKIHREGSPKKIVLNTPWPDMPARLWQRLLERSGIPLRRIWTEMRKEETQALLSELIEGNYRVNGKSTFKEEFVTAGGIDLKEIDFRRFAVKRLPGLFAAGEMLNVDAVTGGFNFQAAWTGGWLAGKAMAED